MSSRSLSLPVIVALLLGLVSVLRYCGQAQRNPVTGEVQRVALSPKQEIALGLHSAPLMMQRHGGELEVESEPGRGSCFRLVFPSARVRPVGGLSPAASVVDDTATAP